MDHAQPCHSRRTDPLCKGLLTSYLDVYTLLIERGYARRTIDGYHACFASQWVCHRRQAVRRVDKALVAEFIDEHLPRGNCAEPVRRNRLELRAALNHLLYRTCPPKLCPALLGGAAVAWPRAARAQRSDGYAPLSSYQRGIERKLVAVHRFLTNGA
jgi:hypothetical protein